MADVWAERNPIRYTLAADWAVAETNAVRRLQMRTQKTAAPAGLEGLISAIRLTKLL
jgi:hypothetical protein